MIGDRTSTKSSVRTLGTRSQSASSYRSQKAAAAAAALCTDSLPAASLATRVNSAASNGGAPSMACREAVSVL